MNDISYLFNIVGIISIWKELNVIKILAITSAHCMLMILEQGSPPPGLRLVLVQACYSQGCTVGGELECNALESSQNHPSHCGPWKNCPPRNQSLVPKRLGLLF